MVRRTVRLPFSKSEPTFDNVITVKEVIKVADPSGDGTMTVLEIVGLIAAILFAVFLATKLTRAVKKIMARRGANKASDLEIASRQPLDTQPVSEPKDVPDVTMTSSFVLPVRFANHTGNSIAAERVLSMEAPIQFTSVSQRL